MRAYSLSAIALLASLGQLPAQSPGGLPTGTVVRVGVPLLEGQRVVRVRKFEGTVVRHTPSSLTLSIEKPLCGLFCDSESVELTMAVDSIQYVEMPVGRSRVSGAIRGLLAGAVLGIFVYQIAGIECDEEGHGVDCLSDGSRPSRAEYLADGGAIGAFVGGMVGWMVGVVRWERVDFRAGPIAGSGGLNVAVRIRR